MTTRLVIIALIFGAAAALGFAAYRIGGRQPGPVAAAPPPIVQYIVAARPLSLGTLARSDDFGAKAAPADALPPGAIPDTADARQNLRGALMRRYLEAGATVTASDFMRPRERGFLSAVLPPEGRAVSIGVNAVSGVAGLISPGDSVDVILTQELPQMPGRNGRQVVSETILSNVRVLAVDQDIAQGATSSAGGAGRTAATVTVQATRDEAERLAVAQKLGQLSLAVRSVDDTSVLTGHGVSGTDVSAALARAGAPVPVPAPPPPPSAGTRVQVIQGDQRSEVTFK
jgi:pilus assembly protein CpaB